MQKSKIKMGMVGGGAGAFIGAIHRAAANLNGNVELVCGAFSANAQRSIESGLDLYLPEDRCYPDYKTMIDSELALTREDRMDFVVIVTPNHLHFPVAEYAIQKGFHVLCDKPVTYDLGEALKLQSLLAKNSNILFGVTYTYSGYPLVHEAKQRIAKGQLGTLRKILVEYTQGWLASDIENQHQKQASWRLDPKKSGISSCMADIGVHAAHLSEFISGQKITHLCADLTNFVEGRTLDDDGSVLLKYTNGVRGTLNASQICVGDENNLSIRVYGDKGSLSWQQQNPNSLFLKLEDKAEIILRAASSSLSDSVQKQFRTPSGHPEGYIEAFANIYQAFTLSIQRLKAGEVSELCKVGFPSLEEGIRGMAFIEACVASSQSDEKWIAFPKT